MEDFIKRCQLFSNAELLEILNSPQDYQHEAVEIAQKELNSRNLNDEDLKIAREELEILKKNKINLGNRRVHNRIKTQINPIINSLNPRQKSISLTEQKIRWITLIFGFFAIRYLYYDIEWFIYTFQVKSLISWMLGFSNWFTSPTLLLPIGIGLFWLRKKIGWTLFCIYLTFMLLDKILVGLYSFWYLYDSPITHSSLADTYSLLNYFFGLILYAVTIWLICQEDIRGEFDVSRAYMFRVIVITDIVAMFMLAPYYSVINTFYG